MTAFNQIDKIEQALLRHFERRRIVFWYDAGAQMQELFQQIALDGVTKCEIQNNEFTLKHQLLVEKPNEQFLVYAPYARPTAKNDWLLDVLLSNEEFHADVLSLHLQEVGLPLEYKYLVEKHKLFFDSADRKTKLSKIVNATDSPATVTLKMISVVCATEPEFDKVWFALFDEEFTEKRTKYNLLLKCDLLPTLWNRAEIEWAYMADEKGIKDLLVHLFSGYFNHSVNTVSKGFTADAKLFINRWKENIKGQLTYIKWSNRLEEELGVRALLATIDTPQLLEADVYAMIDKKIISDILKRIENKTEKAHILQEWIATRKTKLFYTEYESIYKALNAAATIQHEILNSNFTLSTEDDMFRAYSSDTGWHLIDRLYRQYVYYSQAAKGNDLLKSLSEYIDKLYSNSYLLPLSDAWQQKIDKLSSWNKKGTFVMQTDFYQQWVKSYPEKEKRIFVIISDALRYESVAELRERILAQDRYSADLSATWGTIPSYTQLGMAAMLPHKKLSYNKENDTVFVDDISSSGTANRTKILQSYYAKSIAITAEEFMKFNSKTDGREFCKQYNVIYIYSNTVDKTGDDKTSENEVFEATEREFSNLQLLIRHITNMNGNNILLTADHGYIYQNNKLDTTDFTEFSPEGNIYKTNRRFVIGKQLTDGDAVKTWSAEQLGIEGDVEIQIANSINRIRVQGAGSRFVHGGASLQEMVVPVLEINKKREDVLEEVAVDVIGLPQAITGNILPINFYQQKAVSDKVKPIQIKATFYTKEGVQISDAIVLKFDCKENDSRKREQKHSFTFTPEASKQNGEEVTLLLETPVKGSSQYTKYKSYNLKMLISFSSDFDF